MVQQRLCLLPFPNNDYTVPDGDTDSGRRVHFPAQHMPVNVGGVLTEVDELNRNDGFSPGAPIIVDAPGVDLVASGAASLSDIGRSIADDSPILIIDEATGERHPHWAEVDSRADDAGTALLFVRPAKNFLDGHTYIVAIRGLVDSSGEGLGSSEVFEAFRDRLPTTNNAVEERRGRMEEVFRVAAGAGVARNDLWLAWDFTVASSRSLSERVLAMRDGAFEELGGAAPEFGVGRVQQAGSGVRNRTSHYVYGTFQVPNYLSDDGGPGSALLYGADGLPEINANQPEFTASFACIVPAPAVEPGAAPARAVVYGHGLLGSRFEVVEAWDIVLMSSEHNMIYCGTDWIGMTFDDALDIGSGLSDVSQFSNTADRIQQGLVNIQFLARLLKHADGFASDEAFQLDGRSLLDRSDVFYDGNSQGGILGGAATAVSTEWTRAVLGVPGMNFSTLLDRSSAFERLRPILDGSHPDPAQRQIVLALIQMLWDRGEANGYANHLGDDPLPGTPAHDVLLHVALGDFQVADITAFNEARSFGAAVHAPLLGGDDAAIDYGFGLEPIEYPWSGSAVVLWDSGVPLPPATNRPPTGEGDPIRRHDPHEDPRYDADVRRQKSEFLTTDGVVIDVCEGPCLADRYG